MLTTALALLFLAQAAGTPPQASEAEQPWPPPGVYVAGKEVAHPRLVKQTKPAYTADAMREKVQGAVFLQAIVETDGTVSRVRVTRSLDKEYGLDDAAVRTVKEWRFAPGRKDGVAVPVLVDIEMTFTVRGKR